ncbi:MAG: DNA replication/repair protein RecF [Acidimicrobiales bacterium]
MVTTRPGGGVALRRLELHDLRAFSHAALEPAPEGTTVLVGPNGGGKTTFLEAVGFLGTQRSFRTTDRAAMVRVGADRAIVRADLERDGQPLLVEAELPTSGRVRTQVNRQPARDRRHLARAVPVTVFSPDDLAVVRGPPANRRNLLDDALRLLDLRTATALDELDRALRQRAALLRQAGGRCTADIATSLDVWDERLAVAGNLVALARRELVTSLAPLVVDAYGVLAGAGTAGPGATRAGGDPRAPAATPPPSTLAVALAYLPTWEGDLAAALVASRAVDVRRAATTVGPHRDDLAVSLEARDARTQASQGEQRSLALALRLALHRLVTDRTGVAPILLLDDVFSELDPVRSRALVRLLPPCQSLLTTAVPVPPGVPVAEIVDVRRAVTT